MSGALFLDRDGIISRMVKYNYGWDSPQQPQDVRLVDDIAEIITWADRRKIPVIEITNQPGVALGKMSQETADTIEKKIHELLRLKGANMDGSYICPHHPDALIPELKMVCDCRKPKPGLLLKAAKELDIDPAKSIFVGDNASDVKAAKNAGVKSLIYINGEDLPAKVKTAKLAKADFKAATIQEAFQIIKTFFK